MRTIIVCTDFSPSATNAVVYAAALANATESRLVLFHHFNYPVPATDLPAVFPNIFVDEMAAGFERRLKELKDDLAQSYPIKIDSVVRSWDLQSDLEEVLEEEKAGLVVMGMHGQSALANALYGSVTSTAIRRGKLPLLVVSRGVAFHPVKKILFPFDDHAIPNKETVQALRDLAIAFDAYIEVFTLFDLKKTPELVPQGGLSPAKHHLQALLTGIRHGYSYENENAVDKGILYEAARSGADMVTMIPHHHSFLSNLFNQSETQRVAATITLPLLVLGENAKQTAKKEK
ncbi:MAG: universal stress protein [Saprospiraceae bacterium]|nr:universal stress protein [Saprospiraceae bacterium]